MQGLPATSSTILPQTTAVPQDAANACCQAGAEADSFSQVLSVHITERFSAKAALADMAANLQADPEVVGGDPAAPGLQPAVDVAGLAELLAQMAGGLQLQPAARSKPTVQNEAAVAAAPGEKAQAAVSMVDAEAGKEAARSAALGKFLPAEDAASALAAPPGLARESAPDFAQALASHAPDHSLRTEALAMAQARHETLAIRHSQQPQVVEPRVGTPQWDGAVGQKVVWLIGQNQQGADLHLNPPHLGPLEVRLSMAADGQTSVQFVSQHPVVREALENAVPRLREMLADNGIALGNVQVGAESFAERQQAAGEQEGEQGGQGHDDEEAKSLVTPLNRSFERGRLGMLDLFA